MDPPPEALALMREVAGRIGIPVCTSTTCPNVGTHIASWVTGPKVMCEPCAQRLFRVGRVMGVHSVTITLNPDAPKPIVPSKRFQAIGQDLANDR